MATTIDLTPSPEGFVNITKMFLESVLADTKVSRKKESADLLVSIIETVQYLSAVERDDLIDEIVAYVKRFER